MFTTSNIFYSSTREEWLEENDGKWKAGHRGYDQMRHWCDSAESAGKEVGLTEAQIQDCLNADPVEVAL